jgi:hypothetical protein
VLVSTVLNSFLFCAEIVNEVDSSFFRFLIMLQEVIKESPDQDDDQVCGRVRTGASEDRWMVAPDCDE